MIRTPVRIASALAIGAVLAGCSSAAPTRVVTITRTPSRTSSTPAPSTKAATSSAPATATPSTPPTLTKLSGTCDSLLPDSAVEAALGGPLPAGADAFVVGQAEPSIGRIGYLNCRYGVTGKGAAAIPALEIGISLYRTLAQAAARIPATVDDYEAHGATASDMTVAGQPAKLLTGGSGAGYQVPLLVLADGQRTVAVSVGTALATGAKAGADAVKVAALALDRTG